MSMTDHVAVHLQMSFFGHLFTTHHVDERLIPFIKGFTPLGVESGVFVDDLMLDAVEVQVIGPDEILNLPHIQEIFGNILAFFFGSCIHYIKVICIVSTSEEDIIYEVRIQTAKLTKKSQIYLPTSI